MTPHFIVIDDESINNLISRITIRHCYAQALVKEFTDPTLALEFIRMTYAHPEVSDAVVFLDINMPLLNGWDFLKIYDQLDSNLKNRLKIYVLSSSVDERDKEFASRDENVIDYIEKPLTMEIVHRVLKYHNISCNKAPL